MTNMLQVVRFAVGLVMVSAGGLLVAPFLAAVAESARLAADPPVASGSPRADGAAAASAAVFAVPGTDGSSVTVEPEVGRLAEGPREQTRQPQTAAASAAESPVRPAELPPVPPAGPPPGLDAVYRSTVEMPPPPLLDAAAPAAARLGRKPGPFAGPAKGPQEQREIFRGSSVASGVSSFDKPRQQAAKPHSVPDLYRVRDGDDLTAIATTLYGHPRGAAALWEANADRLESPELLPIGMPLVVPPAWQVFQQQQASAGDARRIEPEPMSSGEAGGATGVLPAAWQEPSPKADAAVIAPWLGRPPSNHGAATTDPGSRPRGHLRVAPGETLASIATRVYGDPEMAESLFDANRDRLRSPDVLLPGMELRLP